MICKAVRFGFYKNTDQIPPLLPLYFFSHQASASPSLLLSSCHPVDLNRQRPPSRGEPITAWNSQARPPGLGSPPRSG